MTLQSIQSIDPIQSMYAWDFAYRNARRGHWEQIAHDLERFQRKIVQVAAIIEPVLKKHINRDRIVYHNIG